MTRNLKETDKVHLLFKAFHAFGLPDKRELCAELKGLIEDQVIRGSAQISVLLKMLVEEEIDSPDLEEGICTVLGKEPAQHEETDDEDDELEIQLAQRVPEPEPVAVIHNEQNQVRNDVIVDNPNDRNELIQLSEKMISDIEKFKQLCSNPMTDNKQIKYMMGKLALYMKGYIDLANFIAKVNN